MCARWLLGTIFVFLIPALEAMDGYRSAETVINAGKLPRVIVESSHTLEFGDNAFAMYEFDGRDNKLTCCYMDGDIYAPVYVEYPDDEKKSYALAEKLFGSGLTPTYSFDEYTSWVTLPQSVVRAYRFQQGHRAFTFDSKGDIEWRSPMLTNIKNPITVHPTLPYFVECNEKGFNIYSTILFTNPKTATNMQNGIPESSYILANSAHVEKKSLPPLSEKILGLLKKNRGVSMEHSATAQSGSQELVYPFVTWHPTENKLLVKTDVHQFAEYNGDTKKFEKQFPAKTVWLSSAPDKSGYVLATKQIIALGAPAGKLRRLYELCENEEPRELPISLAEPSKKTVYYNKLIGIVQKYLILECMFSDNPRFLGICDLTTNTLYNVHHFKTEEGSIVFDPNTRKIFGIGHRIYYTYPERCEVYNQECEILRIELGE